MSVAAGNRAAGPVTLLARACANPALILPRIVNPDATKWPSCAHHSLRTKHPLAAHRSAGTWQPLMSDAGRGPAQDRAAAKSEMLTGPCRSVFMQFGRWIVI